MMRQAKISSYNHESGGTRHRDGSSERKSDCRSWVKYWKRFCSQSKLTKFKEFFCRNWIKFNLKWILNPKQVLLSIEIFQPYLDCVRSLATSRRFSFNFCRWFLNFLPIYFRQSAEQHKYTHTRVLRDSALINCALDPRRKSISYFIGEHFHYRTQNNHYAVASIDISWMEDSSRRANNRCWAQCAQFSRYAFLLNFHSPSVCSKCAFYWMYSSVLSRFANSGENFYLILYRGLCALFNAEQIHRIHLQLRKEKKIENHNDK